MQQIKLQIYIYMPYINISQKRYITDEIWFCYLDRL